MSVSATPPSASHDPAPAAPWESLGAAEWGMLSFLASEVAFFATLIVAYLTFLGRDTSGPTPAEVLSLPLAALSTFFLVASSATIHLAEGRWHAGRTASFGLWWGATIVLGAVFLLGTAYEWRELIHHHQLTISTNLFGTTYYTLVGFHAAHVTVGVALMATLLGLVWRKRLTAGTATPVRLVSWYWHFVDGVWIVVFTLVYLVGR